MVDLAPSRAALESVFRVKYGEPASAWWGPAMRWRFGYFNPDDVYEALLDGLVGAQTRWLDVGCGRDLFPSNRPLARTLADRCRLLGLYARDRQPAHEARADEACEFTAERMIEIELARRDRQHGHRHTVAELLPDANGQPRIPSRQPWKAPQPGA